MMSPHWLDSVFAQGAGNDAATWKALTESKRLFLAANKAAVAYQENKLHADEDAAQRVHRQSGSPAQYARVAFLHEINQESDDRP